MDNETSYYFQRYGLLPKITLLYWQKQVHALHILDTYQQMWFILPSVHMQKQTKQQ